MSDSQASVTGRVAAIWRYPVKSMLGEELSATEVTDQGLLGDRAYALVDVETGKVASAKNPRRWPNLFEFRASYLIPPDDAQALPPVRITLHHGEVVTTDQGDAEPRLSDLVGRHVRLARSGTMTARAEGYWPDHDWLAHRDQTFDIPIPPGTFFDVGLVHLVTTATLDRLHTLNPASRFEIPRFRPNFVIEAADNLNETSWIGRELAIGDVTLRIDKPCARCVIMTLSQGGLPKDPGVLRTIVLENEGNVGVYASIVSGGWVRQGDAVGLC
jgi:uncharacterized protein YcbX